MSLFIKTMTPLLSLFLLVSCGKDKSSSSSKEDELQNEIFATDGTNVQGFYAAELAPLNYNLHLVNVGTAGLQRKDDAFSAYVKLKYGHKNIEHPQGIYTGTRCPSFKDDLNKDGFVDSREARAVIGKMLIPLDGDLNSQVEGSGRYPTGDVTMYGRYFYEATASFSKMFADLKAPDTNNNDDMIKLGENDGLMLQGKIVLLVGGPKEVMLPPSVADTGRGPRHVSMPYACGVLKKVRSRPAHLKPEPQP